MNHPASDLQKEVVVQITDMESYSSRTADMDPAEIRDFILHYHRQLHSLVTAPPDGAQEYTPLAGDSSVTLYADIEGRPDKAFRAIHTAINVGMAVEAGRIIPTRLGLFTGNIIEAEFDRQTLSFGNSFAAAARLEQLCGYFRTHLLFDRELAMADKALANYMTSIGKLTPKNFQHPIHAYTVYKPGIHNCPIDVNEARLQEFVEIKNAGMDHFTGNNLKNIPCNFPRARKLLRQALVLFTELTGFPDIPTQRILDYIGDNPVITDEFAQYGMRLNATPGDYAGGTRLLRLPEKLLKALDNEYHKALVQNTEWELYFQLEWINEGEFIVRKGELPDGVYYIESGKVQVSGDKEKPLTLLGEGDIFGEMAYFSESGVRNSDVIAATDVVVRKISGSDFIKFPEIRKVFAEIMKNRSRHHDQTPR